MLRAQALERMHQQSTPVASAETPQLTSQHTQVRQPDLESQKNQISQETNTVKKEIKKILITMGIIVFAVIAIYFINQKTDWVLQTGKYLTKLLNINL